ncbi:MAG: COX15/CtaA family protein [Bryobacteraceae bacterium]|nr:COX15/CtaA family protein [Bryobacteraceae bacterium]
MEARRRYVRLAWAVLGWNFLVILWGAFVRATGSGAGCGSHWPLCNGEVIPPSPTAQTLIEFTHRLTSGLALLGVAALVWWARRLFPRGHAVRAWAWASLAFILVEALLGAGLVLLEYVERNASAGRALYLCAHLTNTFLLLAALLGVAWHAAADGIRWQWREVSGWRRAALAAVLAASLTGAIAALGDTVYPAISMLEGIRQELSPDSPALLRLRLVHPVVSVAAAVVVLAAVFQTVRGRLQRIIAAWVAVQLAAGAVNVLLLAPVWMQILHLALGAGLWLLTFAATLPAPVRGARHAAG